MQAPGFGQERRMSGMKRQISVCQSDTVVMMSLWLNSLASLSLIALDYCDIKQRKATNLNN